MNRRPPSSGGTTFISAFGRAQAGSATSRTSTTVGASTKVRSASTTSRALWSTKLWWEAIDLRERTLHLFDLGGITTAPLVCEDLASLDEVADHVRRVGPTLVAAVLLDGPQLSTRWPCRYSSILTEDPGSTVLTLTSFGMATRSCPPGHRGSRAIAHWNSSSDGLREIDLSRGAAGVLLHTTVERSTVWTADGRKHDVPRLRLSSVD